MPLTPNQRLSHYVIKEKLGQGGMGTVYRATDTRLNRSVAIKTLPPEVTRNPERRARFDQEARLAATFNHPNIATVYDVGEEDGITFIVMEVVQGDSLRKLVGAGQVPVDRVVAIALGIAAGLARAHRDGVVHRDLKPDNVVLTDEGVPKILDFGLGKWIPATRAAREATPADETATAVLTAPTEQLPGGSPYVTRDGQIVGTLAYMSPEQLQGTEIDARSDVFAFGVLLYEMLSGQRPFAAESNVNTMTAILRDDPPPLGDIRDDVPDELHSVIERCLHKDADARYASAGELHDALQALIEHQAVGPAPTPPRRRTAVLVTVGLVALAAIVALAWFGLHAARINRAVNTTLPEAERLADAGDRDGAVRLLRDVAHIVGDDPRFQVMLTNVSGPASFDTEPSGAELFVKGYTRVDRPWIPLGPSPVRDEPLMYPARVRIEKPGYESYEAALPAALNHHFVLTPEGEAPPSMVHVPAGAAGFADHPPADLEEFWIDTYEVTNRAFKEFVDAGGYRDPDHWREPIVQAGRELDFEEAQSLFVDATGRPGPAGWELGSYAEGTADEPVRGVSWYEAAAFAAWAGKSLPTVFHWHRAADQSIFSEILLASNFGGEGPAPVGQYGGIGPVGTYDMAGNVREWCVNRTGDLRYILGGAWPDPAYMYRDPAAADPLDRSAINGFRCIRSNGSLSTESTIAVDEPVFDHARLEPVSDEVFEVFRGMFRYDRTDLDVRDEWSDDSSEHWRKEVVSIRAAYGDERVPVHLYLPKNVPPPWQAVVYYPGADAIDLANSRNLRFGFARFIPQSGRALIYPVYKATYERSVEWSGPNVTRDVMIQAGKDLQRTIDYLETRDDIDTDRLAYYGLSWGAGWGPVYTAIDSRFKASVLLAGGMSPGSARPPEARPYNYFPRSTVPVLVINSRNDFDAPLATEIKPFFAMQGAPEEHKRLVLLDGGHVPESASEFIREVLDWLDRYLGPVE